MNSSDTKARIIALAKDKGVIRPADVEAMQIDRRYLTTLVAEGAVNRIGRGLYTLAGFEATEAHSLVEAARTQSKGVVCLLSALSFHGLGTQLPHQVWLAVPYGARITKVNSAPMRVVVMRSPAHEAGIEEHRIEGVSVPIYGIAKTVADCFKFRGKIGLDVAIEALREALRERRCSRDEIHRYAVIDRVEKVMRPYMEAFSA
jgi:predicted transcriptional regulator of viral defense system